MLCLSDYIIGFPLYNKKLMTCKTQGNEANKAPDGANTEQKRKTTTNNHKKKLLPTRISSMLMIRSSQKRATDNKNTPLKQKINMTLLLQRPARLFYPLFLTLFSKRRHYLCINVKLRNVGCLVVIGCDSINSPKIVL